MPDINNGSSEQIPPDASKQKLRLTHKVDGYGRSTFLMWFTKSNEGTPTFLKIQQTSCLSSRQTSFWIVFEIEKFNVLICENKFLKRYILE